MAMIGATVIRNHVQLILLIIAKGMCKAARPRPAGDLIEKIFQTSLAPVAVSFSSLGGMN